MESSGDFWGVGSLEIGEIETGRHGRGGGGHRGGHRGGGRRWGGRRWGGGYYGRGYDPFWGGDSYGYRRRRYLDEEDEADLIERLLELRGRRN